MKYKIRWLLAAITGTLAVWMSIAKKYQLELNPAINRVFEYSLLYESNTEAPLDFTNFSTPNGKTQKVAILLKANIQFSVIKKQENSLEYLFQITPDRNTSNSQALRLIPDLKIAKIFLKKNGEIERIFFPQKDFDESTLIVTDILRHFIPTLPTKKVSINEIWKASENHDSNRKSLTQWQLTKLSDGLATIKKEYSASAKEIVAGSAEYILNQDEDFLEKISLHWDRNSKDLRNIQSSLSLDAKLLKRSDISRVSLQHILDQIGSESLVAETLDNKAFLQIQERLTLKRTLGLDTTESIQDQISKADPRDRQANMRLYLKIKALFTLFPATASDYASFLLNFDRLDDRFSMVATALTAAGTAEAQNVLREAIQQLDSDKAKKQRLIPNLSFTQNPTIESESFLRELSRNDSSETIRGTAHRALGTIAHALRDHDPGRSHVILNEYREALAASSSKRDQMQNLDVIGNIGLPEQLSIVETYLNSKDSDIRERAYDSLRYIPSSEATNILMNGLKQESEKKIREVIAEALSYQTFTEESKIDQVKQLIYAEKNIVVVKHLLHSISQHYNTFPSAFSIIEQYSKDCGHPDLCGYVESLLQSMKSK